MDRQDASPISEDKSKNNQSHPNESQSDRSIAYSTKVIARLTFIMMITAIINAIVSGFQWVEIHSQSAETEKLIDANQILAGAAKEQAEAAVQSASTARQALLSAQRAWIGPVDAKLEGEIKQGGELKAVVNYQNSGREPGYNFVFDIKDSVYSVVQDENGVPGANFQLDAAACMQREGPQDSQVVFPSTGFTTYELWKDLKNSNIDDLFINGDSILFITGCLSYKSFGQFHHTAFCYFFNTKRSKKEHLSICPLGHRAD